MILRRAVLVAMMLGLLADNARTEDTLPDQQLGISGFHFDDSAQQTSQLELLTEKYDKLQETVDKLQQDQSELQDRSDHFVVPNVSDATMKIAGRIHADTWAFPGDSLGVNAFENADPLIDPQDRLGFRRIRFGVRGDLPQDMLYRIEMEFADGNDVEFRDVFLGWRNLPLLNKLQIGNQKRPYGLDHLNSSRFNVFLERPFIIEAFNQDSRRLGVASYGVSEDEAYNWQWGFFNLRLVQDEGIHTSDQYQSEIAGRLANTFYYDEASEGRDYGHWAVSGTLAFPDGSAGFGPEVEGRGRAANEARFRTRAEARSVRRWLDTGPIAGARLYGLLGLEAVINRGPLQLVAEYMNLWLDRDATIGTNLHLHGGYAYLSYFLTGEHVPWDRESGLIGRVIPFRDFSFAGTRGARQLCGPGAWQIAVRWSYADLSDDNIAGGIGQSVTAGLNWYWTPYARMQFNYIYGNIHDHFPVAGQTFGEYHIIGTRWLVDF